MAESSYSERTGENEALILARKQGDRALILTEKKKRKKRLGLGM
jgi:hypothetical protein